jgi:hypothetical protein
MAWTKAKTAVIAGAAVILATGTGVVVVKETHHARKPVHLAAGALPQTPEELDAWYVEPPAGQNAATVVLRGIDARNVAGVQQMADLPVLGKLPPPDPAAPLPPAVKTALTAFVQRNREALQCFSQAAQFEQSRYPIDLSQGANTLLPHLTGVKSAAQICQMATLLDADNGNGKKAGDDVGMTLAVARSLKAEPTLVSQLVRAAAISLAVDGLNQSVNRTTLPAESLSTLAKMFQNLEDYDTRGEGFGRALVAEKVDHLALLKHPKELVRLLETPGAFGLDDGQCQQLAQHLKNATNLKEEQDFFEATFQQLWTARQTDFPERLKSFDDVLHQRTSEASDSGLLLNKMYWNGVDNAVRREATSLANERLALTALALEQFRAARGNRYPNGLSELTPDFLAAPLTDPFNGQPLHYRTQGAGYVVYSLGPDLKDDGGRRRTGGSGGKGDIVFAVVNPPAP